MLTFPIRGMDGYLVAVAYEEQSIAAVVSSLNPLNFSGGVSHILIRHEAGPSNMRLDGTAPTSGVGFPLFDGDQIWLSFPAAQKFQAIRQGVTNGFLRAIYFTRA